MALTLTILITIGIGIIALFINGKENIKKIITPFFILTTSNFLFLYAKFVVGDDFLTLLIYLPAAILLLVSFIWLCNIRRKIIGKKDNKRGILTIYFCFIITAIIIFIPSLKKDDKFKIYKKDYYAVSSAIFEAYDQGKLPIGEQLASPPYSKYDLHKINSIFSNDIVNEMKKLNKSAGVYDYILADKDAIYFSFGASLQSIDGIAVCRNGKDPTIDKNLKSRFFDGDTYYVCITEGVYHFYDGL